MSRTFKLLLCTAWALSAPLHAEAAVGCGPSLEKGYCVSDSCAISTAYQTECKSKAKCLEWCHTKAQAASSQVTCCEFDTPRNGSGSSSGECLGDGETTRENANLDSDDYGSCSLLNRPHYHYSSDYSTKFVAACSTGCSIGGGSCKSPGSNCILKVGTCRAVYTAAEAKLIKTNQVEQVFNACCAKETYYGKRVGALLGDSSINECLASAAKTVGKNMVTQTQWDAAKEVASFQTPKPPLNNCHCRHFDYSEGPPRCNGDSTGLAPETAGKLKSLCLSIGRTVPLVGPSKLDCQVCGGTNLCAEAFNRLAVQLISARANADYGTPAFKGVCTIQHPDNANGKCSSACVQELNCAMEACKGQNASLMVQTTPQAVDFSDGGSVTTFLKAMKNAYETEMGQNSMAQGCHNKFTDYDRSAENICTTPFVSFSKQTDIYKEANGSMDSGGMSGLVGLSLALLAAFTSSA